jgi:hypothetical protein
VTTSVDVPRFTICDLQLDICTKIAANGRRGLKRAEKQVCEVKTDSGNNKKDMWGE